MAENGPRELTRVIREMTNGGVDLVRGLAGIYKVATSKRDIAKASKMLREWGFEPDTVESLSDDEIKKKMAARTHPPLK